MKNQSKQTIKVDYSAVVSAIKAEAKAKKISFNRVIEQMVKKFVDSAVHPTPKIKRIIIVEVA